jgi:hypothetical protein
MSSGTKKNLIILNIQAAPQFRLMSFFAKTGNSQKVDKIVFPFYKVIFVD